MVFYGNCDSKRMVGPQILSLIISDVSCAVVQKGLNSMQTLQASPDIQYKIVAEQNREYNYLVQ